MPDLVTFLTFAACSAICGRLMTYRRAPGTRYRIGVSVCAWGLVACTGGQALQILLIGARSHPSGWQLGVLLVLAVLSFRARGNVARILKVD
ncbi:phage holin family protein [Pseudoxanthomonas wuyuanensis]|uniref:3TM holin, Phage_holin_3 n=1 Tax=Pseudoxanthomonas wuyuanensis TaxID=1073196 RepID=A0A286D516_9GAMM|nr:phage holin family protein [Pseudoxanthomonas wuyuanensis]KAF1719809.1 phage holin family protein [Pseudoxanthomonas wuyuanensis]SOD53684.1 Putative 3TM holin, Phage_holin_3 [Pseudoxanthomonas wuyuanensis]